MTSNRQIDALKVLVSASADLKPMNIRLYHHLIERSKGFTREVAVVLTEESGFTAKEIRELALNFERGRSRHGSTRIHEVLIAMGIEWKVSTHYGNLKDGVLDSFGQFPGIPADRGGHGDCKAPMRYTFWLAKRHYSKDATVVRCSKEMLEKITLEIDLYGSKVFA